MNTKEAIERIKTRFDKWALDNEDLTALQTLGLVDTDSEDERIRKEIIEYFNQFKDEGLRGVNITPWIAYLEKQKKQKSERINITEMVAKYRVTDEYIEGEYKGKPVNCMIRAYEQGIRDTLLKQKEQKPIEVEVYEIGKGTTICGQDYKCKKDYREGNCWYIKDVIYHCSRDGYLTDQNGISWSCTPEWFKEYIYSSIDWAEKEKTDFVSGQFIQCRKSFDDFKEGEHYWFEYIGDDTYVGRSDNILNQKFHITPRQLYTLFTQQLDVIEDEQKPAEWHPEDEQNLNACLSYIKDASLRSWLIDAIHVRYDKPAEHEKTLLSKFEQAVYDCAWGKVTCKPEGETQEEYAKRWAEQFLLMVRDWADDYIDSQIESAKRKVYDKGKAYDEKPAEWSEEDDAIHTRVLGALGKAFMGVLPTKPSQEDIEWFKSLPERFNLQPKQEWSEEDEKMVRFYETDYNNQIDDMSMTDVVNMKLEFKNWLVNRLKSLRPSLHQEQKPTELPKSEDYGIDGLYAAVDILQKTLGEVDGYQTDDGILEHKCAISAVKELYELQPAKWSEEDEVEIKVLDSIIRYIVEVIDKDVLERFGTNYEELFSWLKSLRGRLKPSNNWKPSKEQMKALDAVANEGVLLDLFNDLLILF